LQIWAQDTSLTCRHSNSGMRGKEKMIGATYLKTNGVGGKREEKEEGIGRWNMEGRLRKKKGEGGKDCEKNGTFGKGENVSKAGN